MKGALWHQSVTGYAVVEDQARQRLMLHCQAEAIRHLQESLANPDNSIACSDANILTIIGLYTNGMEAVPYNGGRGPRQGPLKDLQGLRVYGNAPLEHAHARGLAMMIAMRGGIHSIKLKGLAHAISRYAFLSHVDF